MTTSTSPRYALGRRIVIWGATGSGKTTLSRRLGELLDLPVIELDAIRHERGWDSVDFSEMRERLQALIDRYDRGWISEGGYREVADIYLAGADTVIWLHLPLRTSFRRVFRRTLGRALSRQRLYNPTGPRESLRLTFTTKQSILWWSLSHHRQGERKFREGIASRLRPDAVVYELRSPREVEALLAEASRTAAAAG